MKKDTTFNSNALRQFMRVSFQIIVLLVLSTQLLVAGSLKGQGAAEAKITLSIENASLKQVFSSIQKASGLRFVYNEKLVSDYKNITVKVEKKTVETVLKDVLKNTRLDYLEQNNKIIIVEKANPEVGSAVGEDLNIADITVKGKVTDSKGEGLPGVSIKQKGTNKTTTSDVQGNYTISLSGENPVLIFSFIGFQPQEIPVNNQTVINVTLTENIANLQEVVVIGYGTQRRADVTSAVATVKAKDFVKGPVVDAAQLLQGKVAGLSVASPSGNPTDGTQIVLRGSITLLGNNNPLVLIDGIPGDLKTVAPEDIESVDVLKDGSSAAIYGVRGSAGVIIITTKRASGAFSNNVDYSAYASTQSISKKLDMLTAQDYRNQISAGTRDSSWDAGSNTDWLKEATRTPLAHVHNLTIRGGNSTTNYLASGNYRSLEGIFQKSDNRTFTGRIDVNHNMWDNKLKLNVGILNQTNTFTKVAGGGSFNGWIYRQTVIRNPTEPLYNADGNFYEQTGNFDYENPMALLFESDGQSKNVNSRMNGTITYKPIKDLKLSALFSYTRFNGNNGYSESKHHISTIKNGLNGYASVSSDISVSRLTEWTAEYSKSINDHRFIVLGGYGYQDNVSTGMYSDNQNFPTDAFSYHTIQLGEGLRDKNNPSANMSTYKNQSNLISFFGRLNYSYQDKYLLMGSLRHEGASQLYGALKPWGDFWAISGGWKITNENFMKGQKLFDNIKLRAGYGITGNPPLLRIGNDNNTSNFLGLELMNYPDQQYAYSNGIWTKILVPSQNANPSIRWEEKHEANIGLDFSLLQGRISGNIDAYNRKVKGLLYDYAVPVPPNTFPTTRANAGQMNNKGLEVMLNFLPVKSKDFTWNSSVNFSTNTNKLVSLENDLYKTTSDYFTVGFAGIPVQTFTHIVTVGKSIGDFYGYKVIDVDANGKWIYEGRDGNPVNYADFAHSFEDKKVIGNGVPDWFAGWNNSFSYKNMDLSITMRGAFGYQIINSQRMYMENPAIQNYNILKSAYDPVFGKAVLNVPALEFNSYYVEDGDFWKVDNITFGYNFNKIKNNYIKGARIYVSSLNTFTITKYKGLDPEVDRFGNNGLSPGIDNRDKYPTTRSFTLGVNLNF